MKSLSDEKRLILLAREGDNLSFEKLSFHYLGLINKLSSQYSAEGYEKLDFMQEGLLGLLFAVKSYDESYDISFKNYASICIKNRFLSIVKKSAMEKNPSLENALPLDMIEITDESLNPESHMLNRERLASLFQQAKENLSKREYSVFMLYIKGYSYKEISEKLDISEKSVDNSLSRARKKLLK
ncbi:MAG: sigma-70 family RNA polymerase sigma factor [Oscillospiraceae bacterium]|nr:sigma-70 family RNA polymerase sigma factor [Oscillospiraceae bacterium]